MSRAPSLATAAPMVYGLLTPPEGYDGPRYRGFFRGFPLFVDADSKAAALDALERFRAAEMAKERAREARAADMSRRAKERAL
jgi:hypothetical protein